MFKFLSVVGARPNFMKIAPIINEFKKFPQVEHCLVHSGQHYDEVLSGGFFSQLELPPPDVNLEVGSGTHAAQTAEVMRRLEAVLLDFAPDILIVVGDVNSTLASALTAVKLGISVAHVEAGLRSFDRTMPEEINRKLTDAISDLLFVTEQSGIENLHREGVLSSRIFLVGNVMIDCLLRHAAIAAQSTILDRLGIDRKGTLVRPYGVLTLHRPSNVDTAERLAPILSAVNQLAVELPVFFPVHPRTLGSIKKFGLQQHLDQKPPCARGIVLLEPLGYLDFLNLMHHAAIVLTDSGGIQEETTVLGVPCLTLRHNTERPVTVECGTNQIVGIDPNRITATARKVLNGDFRKGKRPPLWDGQAAERIVKILMNNVPKAASA